MKKKEYIQPVTIQTIVRLDTMLLAGSVGEPGAGIVEGDVEAGGIESRRRGGWLDDED